MAITHLVTHSGGFHADELLSSVILTRLFPEATILRSRDPAWTKPAPDRIVYDVGRAYDADHRIFDHHQRPGPLREDGAPFSSFGLVWKHYGLDYLAALDVPAVNREAIHASFDERYVLPIDMLDNGAMEPAVAGPLSVLTLPSLIGEMKPVFDDPSPTANDDAFADALPIARHFVEAIIAGLAADRRAYGVALQAVAQAGSSRILELPMGMPYRAALDAAGADHVLFTVAPRGDEWTLNGIRLSDETFEQRADLPARWAGLSGEELEQASGVAGASFCHNARFIAVARSRDAIMAMAEIAVREASSTS